MRPRAKARASDAPRPRRDAARGLVADDHDRHARRRHQRIVRGRPGSDLPARRRGGAGRGRLPRALPGPRGGRRPAGGARLAIALIAGLLALTGYASSPFAMLFALVSVAAALAYGPGAGLDRRRPRDRRVRGRPRSWIRTSEPTAQRTSFGSPSASSPPGCSPSSPSPTPRTSGGAMQRVHRPLAHRPTHRPLQPLPAVPDARAGGQPDASQRPRLLRADDGRRWPEGDQ